MKLSEIAKMPEKKEEVEYCEDYQSWGNMGDAYSHGYEIAHARAYNQAISDCSNIEVEADMDDLALIIADNKDLLSYQLAKRIIAKMLLWIRSNKSPSTNVDEMKEKNEV